MNSSNGELLVLLEVVAGQLKNIHHQLEQALLRKLKSKEDDTKWKDKEVRVRRVPVSVVCLHPQPNLRIFAIEELTPLEMLATSIQTSIDHLKPREEGEQ